ncbi:MAG TPA: TlpA disulfide reductase family protein [Levilinea sp.]|nr:TlpA disulfide reductase family protein [Levilinea sp.]
MIEPDATILEEATPARRRLPIWVVAVSFGLLALFLVMITLGLNRAQQGPITIGSRVPEFELTTFDGQRIHTADFDGKVLVINFWASWCKPCEEEAADLETAWQLYKDRGDVIFLGVNYVDIEKPALEYLDKFSITYPNGPDLRMRVSQMFRTLGVPETYVVGKDGHLVYIKKGPFRSVDEITSVIDSALD